jgi:hypothetical protein
MTVAESQFNSFNWSAFTSTYALSDNLAFEELFPLEWDSDPSPQCPYRHSRHDRRPLPLLAILAFAV